MRRGMLMLGLLLMVLQVFSQNGPQQPKNALKLELVGPFVMLRTGFPVLFHWRRFALRYERRMDQSKFLSLVGEAEYRTRLEHFQVDNTDHGFTIQREVSIIAGGRLFVNVLDRKGFDFLCFVEPRLAFTLRNAQLDHYDAVNNFAYSEVVNDFGIVPRLRSGIGFGFGKVMGLEISGDLARHKILGDNRHQWEIFPELSLVFRF